MSDNRICPDCQGRLVFSGDGVSLECERCGHRRDVKKAAQHGIDELNRLRRMMSATRQTNRSMRQTLRQGIGAYHDGHLPAARTYFERVILKTGSHDEEMEAWLWLEKLIEDPAEKRQCLEAVLAIDPSNGEARKALAVLDGRIDPALLGVNGTGAETAGPQAAQSDHMYCPQCTGAMFFDPEKQLLICPYCHHTQTAAEAIDVTRDEQFGQGALEQDFDAAIHTVKGQARPEQVRVLQCQTCGTTFILGASVLSLTCAYCSSVYVTEAAETAELIPPHAVIPFAVTEDNAKTALLNWFKEKKVTRSELTRISPLSAVYIPVWTFDIGGEVRWRGQIIAYGDEHFGSARRIDVFNSKYFFFDDCLQLAMDHQNALFKDLINGYDFEQIVPYDARVLADWPAERYSVPVSDAANRARSAVVKHINKLPHGLSGGDKLDHKSIRRDLKGLIIESYKLVLLPVWTVHYTLKDKPYDLLINGQTGEVEGVDDRGVVARVRGWFGN